MRVLLTGASGSLGVQTGRWLTARGDEVIGVDVRRTSEIGFPLRIRNLLDFSVIDDLLESVDAVVHLANYPNDWARQPAQCLLAENVAMTANVLTAAVDRGVRRIVYASSIQACRGPRKITEADKPSTLPYLPLDGDLPAHGCTPYGLSKVVGELELQMHVRKYADLCAVAVRFPGIWHDPPQQRFSIPPEPDEGYAYLARRFPLDEAFAWVWLSDAVRFIGAALDRAQPGLRIVLPAAAVSHVDHDAQWLSERFFKGVPHKQSLAGRSGLVDLEPLERDFGWMPSDPLSLKAQAR
jgi:nucleoside-diphosphate-sugar epimerase